MKYRSNAITAGSEWANVRALYKANGFTSEEIKRPKIAIVNTYNNICPGHMNLQAVTQRVKEGICAAGGMALEFGNIGACDGIAMGHKGMRYILPAREMIASNIEVMAEAHQVDGLVLVGSCDKIVPGLLLGALRTNLPSIFINGGPALPGRMKKGNPYGGEYIDHSIIQESEGALQAGEISQKEFQWIEENAVPTVGSCSMLGTANTMCCLMEVLGIALPEAAAIPAVYSKRMQYAYETGKKAVMLVEKNIRPADIVTKAAICNAIQVNSAIGGSTNSVLHLMAAAYEAGVELTIFEYGKIAERVPHLVPLIPAGPYTLLDFYEAGGIPAVIKEMEDTLELEGITCTGKSMKENICNVQNRNRDVIHSVKNPVQNRSGIAILQGNLAPEGAVTKPSAIPEKALVFAGPAKIFEGEEDALLRIREGEIIAGEVIVIRNEGPKGGPGMPEMYKVMKLLVGMGLGEKVCVITDGRFSGSNNGCFVGHICPEAAAGGPIAFLEDGDWISVDIANRQINVLDVDFEQRKKEWRGRLIKNRAQGCLYQYQKNVLPASQGAVIPTR